VKATTEQKLTKETKAAAVPMYFAGKAREVAEFCLRKGGQCFENWDAITLFTYVFFHLVDGNCFVVRKNGGIAGVLFLWGATETDIRQRAATGESPFYWQRSMKAGDALFLAEVVSAHDCLPTLFKLAAAKWPDWQQRKVFTYREGRLIQLPVDLVKRMIFGHPAAGSESHALPVPESGTQKGTKETKGELS